MSVLIYTYTREKLLRNKRAVRNNRFEYDVLNRNINGIDNASECFRMIMY